MILFYYKNVTFLLYIGYKTKCVTLENMSSMGKPKHLLNALGAYVFYYLLDNLLGDNLFEQSKKKIIILEW